MLNSILSSTPFLGILISTILLIPALILNSILLAAFLRAYNDLSNDSAPYFDNIPNTAEFNSTVIAIVGCVLAAVGIMLIWCAVLLIVARPGAGSKRRGLGWGKHERPNGIALAVLAPLLLFGTVASYFGVLAGGKVGTAKSFKSVGAAGPIFCLLGGVSLTITAALLFVHGNRYERRLRDSEGKTALTEKYDSIPA